MNWFDQSIHNLFYKPLIFSNAARYPAISSAKRNILRLTNIFKQHFVAFKDYISISASITRLLSPRRPSAILFAVPAIVVNPIQRSTSWSAAHVGKKTLVRGPLFAIGNSSSAVVFPLRSIGVVTPTLHGRPNSVFRGIAIAVSFCFLGRKLFSETAAANNKTAPKRIKRSYSAVTAITQVAPVAMF